jgi:hypothetical protein
MGELGVHGPCARAGGGPARGRRPCGAAWAEPVNSLINRLWTTSVDNRSLSVRQVRDEGHQLDPGVRFRPPLPPLAPSSRIAYVFESLPRGPYEPALAWIYRRRGSRRSPLRGQRSRRHARRHGVEMTFDNAELGRGAGSGDGGWHDQEGEGVRGRWQGQVSVTAATGRGRPGARTTARTTALFCPSNAVVNVRISGGVARKGIATGR